MTKQETRMLKGVAIIIMLMHHFVEFSFCELPAIVTLVGHACKICVAIYAVLSGYGYFYAKEKTIRYGLRKIWRLLQVYWLSLFTLFIPAAIIRGGWQITFKRLFVQLFGLLPNLNWFAWYVFFYVFCMLLMPLLCKMNLFRYCPFVNLTLMIAVPYVCEVLLKFSPYYEMSTIVHDLFSCFLYFPCFLIGYWMADNQIIDRVRKMKCMQSPVICVIGVMLVFVFRILLPTVAGFLVDLFYAPMIICFIVSLMAMLSCMQVSIVLEVFGKYSTEIWFVHAVFFSTYVCDWFKPLLAIVPWWLIRFLWLVVLSFIGAYISALVLDGIRYRLKVMKGRINISERK